MSYVNGATYKGSGTNQLRKHLKFQATASFTQPTLLPDLQADIPMNTKPSPPHENCTVSEENARFSSDQPTCCAHTSTAQAIPRHTHCSAALTQLQMNDAAGVCLQPKPIARSMHHLLQF